jgi:hypothetical protein
MYRSLVKLSLIRVFCLLLLLLFFSCDNEPKKFQSYYSGKNGEWYAIDPETNKPVRVKGPYSQERVEESNGEESQTDHSEADETNSESVEEDDDTQFIGDERETVSSKHDDESNEDEAKTDYCKWCGDPFPEGAGWSKAVTATVEMFGIRRSLRECTQVSEDADYCSKRCCIEDNPEPARSN